MVSLRMLSLAALVAVGAAHGSPCTTVGPTPAPYVPPASPCSTAAPTPPKDCSSFACPANYLPKSGVIMCGNIGQANCDSEKCCDLVTTVTTTPMVTVTTTPGTTVTTTPGTTVTTTPATTVTTTPMPTCSVFTCPEGFSKISDEVVCSTGHCHEADCCTVILTTVTTTPAPTCATFICDDGYSKNSDSTVCSAGECNSATCCTVIPTTVTTTPYVPPSTTEGSPCAPVVPAPGPAPVPSPSSPCETAPPTERKYDAKEAALARQVATPEKDSSRVPAWAFPLFGVVGMFTFAAFVSARACGQRSTRQFSANEPVLDEEAFMSDVGAVE